MASFVLFLAVLSLIAVPISEGCAWPRHACKTDVCKNLSPSNYNAVLDKTKFTVDSTSNAVLATWSTLSKNDLAFFANKYNPSYNGGKYDADKEADGADNAPFINYLKVRSNFGTLVSGVSTLRKCCDACRADALCSRFMFNPQVTYTGGVISSFKSTGGECYLLKETDRAWTYNELNKMCKAGVGGDNATALFQQDVKGAFYGGLCNPAADNDPHFIGARGTRFDFNGELDKSFCLLTDTRLQVNAVLRGYEDPRAGEKGLRSWMKEVGVIWADQAGQRHSLHLVARKGKEQQRGQGFLARAMLDGTPLAVPSQAGASVAEGLLQLTFEGTSQHGPYEVDRFRLTVGDLLDLTFSMRTAHRLLQTPTDAEVHFNLVFNHVQLSDKIHGVLGQTYRQTSAQEMKAVKYSTLNQMLGGPVQADGKSGEGFLEGQVADYETSSVTQPDCKFSAIV